MLGIDRLAYWAKQFGFGAPTGIDLPGEASGIVPTNQWKQDTFGQPIFPGETYQAGIGQGYDVVTPIQLINAYAALANGGKLYQPQIVRQVIGPDGKVVRAFKPELIRKLPVSQAVLRRCASAARTVTIRHTYNLVDLPIKVAGKSGTAEFGLRDSKGRLPFHSWFVGFVPKDPYKADFARTGFAARGPRVRLRLADDRQRGDRDREVLPAAPLRDQEGLPDPRSPQARQLLPEQLDDASMRVMRAEPARVPNWAARSVGAAWRAFDLQLTIYAALLGVIGLAMAYTNSVEAGGSVLAAARHSPAASCGLRSRSSCSSSRRRSTTTGSRRSPGRSTSSNLGLLVLTLAIGDGVGGAARWVTIWAR